MNLVFCSVILNFLFQALIYGSIKYFHLIVNHIKHQFLWGRNRDGHGMAGIIRKYALIEIVIVILVAFYALFPPSLVSHVWVYATFSFARMLAAYILSLIFSILYGFYAATNKRAERIMIPVLDILQSIPILGFFPIALYLLIVYLPTAIGVELASIILIFTSQAWNMAFGVYESILTVPNEIKDAANIFKLKGMRRFRVLYLPAMIPRLVYNSMMSWAGGWYFLFAAEIISVGNTSYTIPGLGSFMWKMVGSGNVEYGLLALVTLIVIIVTMDIVIWRPLTRVSEKYKYESLTEEQIQKRFYLAKILDYMPSMDFIFRFFRFRMNILLKGKRFRLFVNLWKYKRYISYAVLAMIFAFTGYALGVALARGIVIDVPVSALYPIPAAILLSIARLAIAYGLSLAWIIPVAIFIKSHRQAERSSIPFLKSLHQYRQQRYSPSSFFF